MRRSRTGASFDGIPDEELRGRLASLRTVQREIRREAGPSLHREDALALVDRLEEDARRLADEALSALAGGGMTASALGAPARPLNEAVRAAALLDHVAHGGFLSRLREAIERASCFSTLSRADLAHRLEPSENEAESIRAELARRHTERQDLRHRLAALEA